MQFELQEEAGDDWWLHPPWNPHKTRPSVLDVERLLRQHRAGNSAMSGGVAGKRGEKPGSERPEVPLCDRWDSPCWAENRADDARTGQPDSRRWGRLVPLANAAKDSVFTRNHWIERPYDVYNQRPLVP